MELQVHGQLFILTDHIQVRMSDRDVSLREIRGTLEFGTQTKQTDGSTRIAMDCDALDRARNTFLNPYVLFGITLVVKEGNVLLTVMRNIESARIA
jgi:hypothetical protein